MRRRGYRPSLLDELREDATWWVFKGAVIFCAVLLILDEWSTL